MKRILYTLRRSRHINYLSIIAMLIGGGATFGWFSLAKESRVNRPVNLVIDERPIQRDGTVPRSFADVVDQVAPSVVRVNTESKAMPSRSSMRGMSPHPFFDRFFDPRQSIPTPDLPMKQGLGSGVIISPDGYILTNNHVIQGAERIEVVLAEPEKSYQAELVGGDPKSDLAVLKIDADGLPYTRIGNSDQIRVGDMVLAIGNPFGVGQTVTMGIVGATGRASIGLDYEDFIQTDAAINPGNSGGALVDIEGRLVGINTAILSKTGSHQGIGFAIPTNLARNVMEDLIEHGHVTRGFLGVMIQDVSPQLADYFDIPNGKGALVAEVTPSSPADKAGLVTGDVITRVNDTEIRDSRHLKLFIGASDPDSTHDFSILREGERQEVTVRLAELDDKATQVASYSDDDNSDGTLDGVTVSDIDSRARQELQIPRRLRGALVVEVERDSASWRAGLRPGDVIREINRERVESADEAVTLSEQIEDEIVLVRVWRKGTTLFLAVEETDLG